MSMLPLYINGFVILGLITLRVVDRWEIEKLWAELEDLRADEIAPSGRHRAVTPAPADPPRGASPAPAGRTGPAATSPARTTTRHRAAGDPRSNPPDRPSTPLVGTARRVTRGASPATPAAQPPAHRTASGSTRLDGRR